MVGIPLGVILRVASAAPADFHVQVRGQGVHYRSAHAMQAAGYLVRRAVELAARVQGGHNCFQSGHSRVRMDVHWDSAAIVGYTHGAIGGEVRRSMRSQ